VGCHGSAMVMTSSNNIPLPPSVPHTAPLVSSTAAVLPAARYRGLSSDQSRSGAGSGLVRATQLGNHDGRLSSPFPEAETGAVR
jgi:hypothetical protein